jgi:hypothetical protein
MICFYNTYIRQIKFIQGNVISSEYAINEYVHNVPRQNLKTIEKYLHNAHRTLNQYTTMIKIL